MPTPTDLVTDLPADFEVFGQAVDTSMADLKGGTTGQILSKATNTDMDFTWITNDVGDITAVTVTAPITGGGTSGSVGIGISAASTSASGAVQLSDSTSTTSSVLASTPTATKSAYDLAASAYAPAFTNNLYAGKNCLLNSNYSIWQRGTSVAGATAVNYGADRWQIFRAGSTMSRQVTGDTTNLAFIQYCARIQRDSGTTGTSSIILNQSIETSNSIPYAGKTVALSFYARKGANYSQAASSVSALVYSGTGTNENQLNGFTGQATVTSSLVVLTSTWQRFTITGTVGATATQLAVAFQYTPVGTAGAADYFEITGVQLEAGSTATPFQTASGSTGSELALCQRYYYRLAPGATSKSFGVASSSSTTAGTCFTYFPVEMRVTPTSLDQTGTATDYSLNFAGTTTICSGVPVIGGSITTRVGATTFAVASGLVAGQAGRFQTDATTGANAYLGWSAEL